MKEFSKNFSNIKEKNNISKINEEENLFKKMPIQKEFIDLTNQSFLPKNPKIYYSSIPLSKNIKTFKDHPVLFGYF